MSLQPQCLASRALGACLGVSTAMFHHCSVSFSACVMLTELTRSLTLTHPPCV